MQIYEPAREAAVMAHVRTLNAALDGPLDGDAVVRLYERIMDEARRIQRIEAERTGTPAAAGSTDLPESPEEPIEPLQPAKSVDPDRST
jgi:hypothetical protein